LFMTKQVLSTLFITPAVAALIVKLPNWSKKLKRNSQKLLLDWQTSQLVCQAWGMEARIPANTRAIAVKFPKMKNNRSKGHLRVNNEFKSLKVQKQIQKLLIILFWPAKKQTQPKIKNWMLKLKPKQTKL
jgi:hypothetical protein